jgi:hypothetical protein
MSDLIEKLSNLRSQYNCFDENERDAYHTLSEAIKVLSERLEPCEDAVSRKAVYEAMIEKGQRSRRYRLGETWELNGTEIREALDTVPSVTPKRKTGKWIHSDFSHEFLHCSECGRGRHFCSNFCPNCGADMRQREENK